MRYHILQWQLEPADTSVSHTVYVGLELHPEHLFPHNIPTLGLHFMSQRIFSLVGNDSFTAYKLQVGDKQLLLLIHQTLFWWIFPSLEYPEVSAVQNTALQLLLKPCPGATTVSPLHQNSQVPRSRLRDTIIDWKTTQGNRSHGSLQVHAGDMAQEAE